MVIFRRAIRPYGRTGSGPITALRSRRLCMVGVKVSRILVEIEFEQWDGRLVPGDM
jgi:hypothetical protein